MSESSNVPPHVNSSKTKDSQLLVFIDHISTFSLAAQQNAYPVIHEIRLSFPNEISGADAGIVPGNINNLIVKLEADHEAIDLQQWFLDSIEPGQSITLQNKALDIPFDFLFGLTEEVLLSFSITVSGRDSDEVYATKEFNVSILPANFWGGETRQPDLLAAFVKPNGLYVESLVKQVTQLLEKNGHGRSVDGYQSNTREKPYLMVAALWQVIFSQDIAYVTPPKGFAEQGQRIRLASEISGLKMGACLDTSVLFASCIELMGLNPVIAVTHGHAFVGAWLIDENFPVLTNDDAMDLRKRCDARDLVLFETTLVTNSFPVSFEQASNVARELISEEKERQFVYVIDISQARARKIKPLLTVEEQRQEFEAEQNNEWNMPIAPALPPVRADEKKLEETPDTRIDTWQRKLLDLTKRNALLAFKDRSVAIRLYCPNIGAMEDRLASGTLFTFKTAESSPLNDKTRSDQLFKLQTGSDIHQEYALEQLEKNTLMANMSARDLDRHSVSLLRKAKNDLEEGGSNTSFLALGMLRWRETPNDKRSFRAPLIMIPAQLVRSSARNPVKVRQLPDEAPIFNLTLIEFLETEYNINLNQFRSELPEDESGVDVKLVWDIVRNAVADVPGFEVVEELVISRFSFSKYLMWKDLKDRMNDLKKNRFVKHLVDNPLDAYIQDSSFVDNHQVDEKIDPQNIFTPLNCDSSQLVAVEASGRAQDFVLEGPPGTGKSETIANIICHNIALGRKVLFVAEKMAALQVVYRRLDKININHLCLELHSNKANKKAVLAQLKIASEKTNTIESVNWLDAVKSLKKKRDDLNNYVLALHAKSQFGLSVRNAISRSVKYEGMHALNLTWPMELASSPIQSREELEVMLDIVTNASHAFSDVVTLNADFYQVIKSKKWSNAWQSKSSNCLEEYKERLLMVYPGAKLLASIFNLNIEKKDLTTLNRIANLAELISITEVHAIAYLLTNPKNNLRSLGVLSQEKSEFDQYLKEIKHNVTPALLDKTPIDDWCQQYEQVKDSWFKRFFTKLKINRIAKQLGYVKFSDFSILGVLKKAKKSHDSINKEAPLFVTDNIWQGWDTSAKNLNEAYDIGIKAFACLSSILNLTDDPADVLTLVKSKLVDGRDFLPASKLVEQKNTFYSLYQDFFDTSENALVLGITFNEHDTLEDITKTVDELVANAPKFKVWCEWQEAKASIDEFKLDNIAHAFESKTLTPDQAREQTLTAFCRWLAPQLIDNNDLLREFKSSAHNELIKEFRTIDALVANTTSEYVAAIAASKLPDLTSENAPKEFNVLARELQKKTRHKPVRVLINEMGKSLLDLCPCLMMSPLSVAQFLPSNFNEFDLVIFDEASQMTTWDSVGAIARGKNVIVVGDPKQMPPTNYFNSIVEAENPDEEDLESILDQALAARLPHLRLKGHYRSRHETLIAFSNKQYYENALVTFPSPDTKESAVILHLVKGIYSKGKNRNNPIEATAVVAELVKRLTGDNKDKHTLGIVTLNGEQQRTIEDLLDEARREFPSIEKYFHSTDTYDGVFVKNLESVQGDERDVILISLGYGPTELGVNKMSMNFGPLNKSGGERRLNVAITRATTEVLLFSSFNSSMIDLGRTSSKAIADLKQYIDFAERGPISLPQETIKKHGIKQGDRLFEGDFEQTLAIALRDKGWDVRTRIGVSKLRIDLGVFHPKKADIYLAGIECDGATYHQSPSARDRDRVRHIVLEGLGWNILRVWATDYFHDPELAITRIDAELTKLLEDDLI